LSLLKKHSRPAPPDARWASRRARRVLRALLPIAAVAVLSGDAGTIGRAASGRPASGARAAGTLFLSPSRFPDSMVGANLVFALGEHKVRPYPAAGQGLEATRRPRLAPLVRPGMTGYWAPHGLVRRRGPMGTTRRRSVNVLWGE
jgi:hypothetical protein